MLRALPMLRYQLKRLVGSISQIPSGTILIGLPLSLILGGLITLINPAMSWGQSGELGFLLLIFFVLFLLPAFLISMFPH